MEFSELRVELGVGNGGLGGGVLEKERRGGEGRREERSPCAQCPGVGSPPDPSC